MKKANTGPNRKILHRQENAGFEKKTLTSRGSKEWEEEIVKNVTVAILSISFSTPCIKPKTKLKTRTFLINDFYRLWFDEKVFLNNGERGTSNRDNSV